MSWRLGLGLVLLVAAIFSGWSAWKQRQMEAPTRAEVDRSDYVMYDFEMVGLDKQGKESITLRAPEMHRQPADDSYTISTPLFLMPDKDGQYWQMRSKTGWVSAKGDELRLLTDVTGTSPKDALQPTLFKTSRLNIFPAKNLATSDAAVSITRPGSILSGVGFETDLKTRRYAFKSQVKSRYEPQAVR